VKFRSTLLLGGKTATGIKVPDHIVVALGSSKRPMVVVTIGTFTYRSSIVPRDGAFMLPVSAEVRAGAGIAAGDEVDVEVQLDTAPREVTVPADFAAALDGCAEARTFFDGLSYSNQLRHVLSIESAKTPETRARRIEKSVSELRAGKK
jgi:Bacteriocin-protection, YdeI or OmpD-Associated/Domain of unknown function (DUF1905)